MCAPEHFAVEYAINPWMDLDQPVDARAGRSSSGRACGRRCVGLGHTVHTLPRCPACPTWCSRPTARSRVDGVVYGARFRYAAARRRGRRAPGVLRGRPGAGGSSRRAQTNEGEGDFAYLPGRTAAWCWPGTASGPSRRRTPRRRRCSAARWCRCAWSTRASTTSTWRWPRSTTRNIAYYPGAFSTGVAAGAGAALPGRRGRRRGRRAGVRPQPGQRRPPRGAQRRGDRAGGEAGRGAGYVPVPVELGELQEGRRQRQVLRRRAAP